MLVGNLHWPLVLRRRRNQRGGPRVAARRQSRRQADDHQAYMYVSQQRAGEQGMAHSLETEQAGAGPVIRPPPCITAIWST